MRRIARKSHVGVGGGVTVSVTRHRLFDRRRSRVSPISSFSTSISVTDGIEFDCAVIVFGVCYSMYMPSRGRAGPKRIEIMGIAFANNPIKSETLRAVELFFSARVQSVDSSAPNARAPSLSALRSRRFLALSHRIVPPLAPPAAAARPPHTTAR